MPLPAGVETVTVTSGEPFALLDGTLYKGRLFFTGPGLVTIGEDDVILGGTVPVDLAAGEFSVTLVATDATGMSPTGWTYKVTSRFTNAPNWVRYITLPKATTPVKLADILVPDPVAGEFTVLVDPSSIPGATPASTVVTETTYGQASAVGTGTPYARDDHTHGTPALPSAADVGADTEGAAAAAQSAAASDATAKVATHAGADDPHGDRADAASKYVPLSGGAVVSGEVTFNDTIPIGPASDPAFANQLGRKAYIDAGDTAALAAANAYTDANAGGSSIVSADGRIDIEIIVLAAAASWTIVTTSTAVEIGWSVPAAVGDRIWYSPSFMRTGGVIYLDMGIKAAAGGVSRYTSSGTATPETEGYGPMYPQTAFVGIAGLREFIVQSGEVDGSGNATIVLAYKGPADGSTQKLYFGGGYSGAIFVANMGPLPA